MGDYSTAEIIAQIETSCLDLPPIKDAELDPKAFDTSGGIFPSSLVLAKLRGRKRLEPAAELDWLDGEILFRMTGYSRLYFAPSIMLLILKHQHERDFDTLSRALCFSDSVLQVMGIPPRSEVGDFSKDELDLLISKFDISSIIKSKPLQCLADRSTDSDGSLDIEHFISSAVWFNAVEKRVVSNFLSWLELAWPEDMGVYAAVRAFWNK